MKTTVIIMLTLAIACSASAQENPFEEFGYTPKIATLSGGKYIEYFDRDTIVQIGSIVYNTKSKKIVGFVEEDTAYSEATLQPDIVSRWISPDPMAYMAPGWTPYRFGYNNPIYFTDPTGLLEDNYTVDDDGNIALAEETDDDFDMLYKKDDFDAGKKDDGLKVNDRSILPDLAKERNDFTVKDPVDGEEYEGNYAETTNRSEAWKVFKYAASNSNVEWNYQRFTDGRIVLSTAHQNSITTQGFSLAGYDWRQVAADVHSHPGDTKDDLQPSGTDMYRARQFQSLNHPVKVQLFMPRHPNPSQRLINLNP